MKIVHWNEHSDPVIVAADGDTIVIEDTWYWDDFEEGDMIQHTSDGFGTGCYFVLAVELPDGEDFVSDIRLVTIKGAIS